VIYKGSLPDQPEAFELDGHHLIERGKVFPVCGNTWRMLADTRLAPHFDFMGDLLRHLPRLRTSIPFATTTFAASNSGGSCC
jgi:arsenite methyltransferase